MRMRENNKKWLVVCIFLISFIIPFLMCGLITSESTYVEDPRIQSFSKDDFAPILEEKSQGLGNITITDVTFNEKGFFNNTQLYPDLDDDLSTGALDLKYKQTSFLETISIAQYDNLDDSILESNEIKVLLNESISVEYDISVSGSEGFLIYGFSLSPVIIKEIYVHNQTSDPIEKLSETQYSIDSANFFSFEYFDYFQMDQNNFSIYILYEYEIKIKQWTLDQLTGQDLVINKQEQSIISRFNYNFTFSGKKYNKTLSDTVPAYNFRAAIGLNLPDKEMLFDHSVWINDIEIEGSLKGDNSLNFTAYADDSQIMVNFNANYTIRFEDPVASSWAIDRLADLSDNRERIYFPSLISGPEHIFIEKIYLFENTITIDQVLINSSIFGRSVAFFDANVSIIQESLENSLIFTENSVKKKGIRIILPYMIKGETVPFILKYKATNDLRIVITDNINMPLRGIKAELYYFEKPYGTYISNGLVQPMAPVFSNEHGEVIIYNVPNGFYQLRIYQNNQFLTEAEVSSFQDINYIVTDIFHFPFVILIFITIYSTIFLIGLIFYLKNKRN